MSALRVGIAGIGSIARDYISLFADGKIQGGIITALCSRNRDAMADAASTAGLTSVELFTDYSALLASGRIDVVIICTPHALHPAMAAQALARGIAALVEKPVGASRGDAQELLESLRANPQVPCGVLYCHRMNPLYRRVKELLAAGTIGELKRATWIITNLYRTEAYHRSAPWRGRWDGECGGVLMTQASHQLDLFLWFCGEPEQVQAICRTRGRSIQVENEAALQMVFRSGACGQFIASSHEFPGSNRLELSGDSGQIIVADNQRLSLRRLEVPESRYARVSEDFFGAIPYTETTEQFPVCGNREVQAAIIQDFLRAVQTGASPACPVAQAVDSLAVINAAYLSAWRGQAVPLSFSDDDYQAALHAAQA